MKVALVFGKGLDGCGVHRFGLEMQTWALKNSIDFDIFSLNERRFTREKMHTLTREPIEFGAEEIPAITKKLNEYDVVIINSYPSSAHKPETVVSFYENLVKKIENPILVGMVHEIKKANLDRIPMIIPILNYCDMVYTFSEKTWFSQNIAKILTNKKLGERINRFVMPVNLDDLNKFFKKDVKKEKRLAYIGRWTSMKDPHRLIDLEPLLHAKDPEFELYMYGIERSIGAKYDILDNDNIVYEAKYDKVLPYVPNKVMVYGPYEYNFGMEFSAKSMFTASFFNLPKEVENYGDRMEYTQIEAIGVGSIPVYDKNYGQFNFDSNGDAYINTDHLAIWSDSNDLPETVDKLLEVANDPVDQEKYRESGFDFLSREFDADIVLKKFFDEINSTGKDTTKFMNDEDLLHNLFKDKRVAGDLKTIIASGNIPAIGFKEISNKTLSQFEKKARIVFKDYNKVEMTLLF